MTQEFKNDSDSDVFTLHYRKINIFPQIQKPSLTQQLTFGVLSTTDQKLNISKSAHSAINCINQVPFFCNFEFFFLSASIRRRENKNEPYPALDIFFLNWPCKWPITPHQTGIERNTTHPISIPLKQELPGTGFCTFLFFGSLVLNYLHVPIMLFC